MAEGKTTTFRLRPSRSTIVEKLSEEERGSGSDGMLTATYKLSTVDSIMPRVYTRLLFLYEVANAPPFQLQTDNTRADIASVANLHERIIGLLRASLESTLQSYPILYGRLREDPATGALSVLVKCTAEDVGGGVNAAGATGSSIRLVVRDESETSAAFQELSSEGFPLSKLDGDIFSPFGLLPVVGSESSEGSDQGSVDVFAVQLTFVKGGMVMCVAVHHCLCDGPGFASFMKKLLAAARLGHAVPSNHREEFRMEKLTVAPQIVEDLRSSDEGAKQRLLGQHPEYRVLPQIPSALKASFRPSAGATAKVENVANIFKIPFDGLERLKAAAQPSEPSQSGGEVSWVSTHDAICALVWRCVMKARFPGRDPREPGKSILGQAVNSRSRIVPPLPEEYFGSVNFYAAARMDLGDVVNGASGKSLEKLAVAVRNSINAKTNETVKSALKYIALQDNPALIMHSFTTVNDYTVTSWVAMFKAGDLDFTVEVPASSESSGDSAATVSLTCRAVRVPKAAFDGLGIFLPSFTGRKEGVEVLMGLKKEAMDLLMKDEEWMSFVSRVVH